VREQYEFRVRQLMKKLTVAADPGIVEGLSAELLSQRPTEVLAELLSALGRMAQEEHARIIYTGVVRLCLSADKVPQPVKEGIYSILAARGEGALARYLLPVPARREVDETDMPRDLELEQMTLGMRKWKARGHARELLMRLSRDRDPAVFRILLGNPRLTEDDVLAWTARRPTMPQLQLEVAAHRSWSTRPRIQEALVRNPYTPTHVAAAFVPLLSSKQLRIVHEDGSLHVLVREAARDVMTLRGRTEEP
jgi:hypothetical protein